MKERDKDVVAYLVFLVVGVVLGVVLTKALG